jgi:branched-chain amino acid transport system substrate-binding protein
MKSLRIGVVVVAAAAMVGATACGSSSHSSSSATTTAGTAAKTGSTGAATGTPIKVGLVTSLTGPAAQNFIGAQQGVAARFDLQNAEGGINGRPLKLVVGDDQSTVQGGQTAVGELSQTQGVFSEIFISDLVSAGYRTAQQLGIPVVGAPIDGPEWGTKPNTNMVSVEGDAEPVPPASTMTAQVAKSVGATNMAGLAIAAEEPSIIGVQEFVAGAKKIGLKVGYINESTPLGGVNVTPLVLAMKAAHVDGFDSEMLDTTNFAIQTAAKQAGLKLVAPIAAVGYDQALLDDPSALAAAQGGIFTVEQVPVEEHTAATIAEQAAFEKYEHFSGVPNLNWTFGWESADLTIQGLLHAGSNLTRASYLSALRGLKGWTAGGLLPVAPDFSLADFGKTTTADQCSYFAQLEGKGFVAMNHGKPYCGPYLSS